MIFWKMKKKSLKINKIKYLLLVEQYLSKASSFIRSSLVFNSLENQIDFLNFDFIYRAVVVPSFFLQLDIIFPNLLKFQASLEEEKGKLHKRQ